MEDDYIEGMRSCRKQSPGVEHAVVFAWNKLLSTLLTARGLYQNLSVDSKPFDRFADENYSAQQLASEFSSRPIRPYSRGEGDSEKTWKRNGPLGASPIGTPDDKLPLSFYLPNVQLECTSCHSESSFLSMSCSADHHQTPYPLISAATEQVLHLYYRCATCRKQYIVFQVLRRGLKAQLTGRSQPYRPRLDKVWPAAIVDIIRDAICADAENDVCAAYYHLRTAIEFYIKNDLSIPITQKIEGNELCEKYNERQDARLRANFPSLGSMYRDLSAGLHSRVVDSSKFSAIVGSFADHLRAKELFVKYTS